MVPVPAGRGRGLLPAGQQLEGQGFFGSSACGGGPLRQHLIPTSPHTLHCNGALSHRLARSAAAAAPAAQVGEQPLHLLRLSTLREYLKFEFAEFIRPKQAGEGGGDEEVGWKGMVWVGRWVDGWVGWGSAGGGQ